MCGQNQEQNKKNKNKSLFKIYDIFQDIVIQETKEFYEFSEVILMVLVAILGMYQHWETSSFLLILGLVISTIWFAGFVIQIMWRRHWQGRIRNVEDEIIKEKELELNKVLIEDRDNWVPGLFYRENQSHKRDPKIKFHFNFIFGLFPVVFVLVFTYKLTSPSFYLNYLKLIGYLCRFRLDCLNIVLPFFLILLLYLASYKYFPFKNKEIV